LKGIFSFIRNAWAKPQNLSPLSDWFRVEFDDAEIKLSVNPPRKEAWNAHIKWEAINRVCFKAGDLYNPDEIYIFTIERPESYLIPTEANGGDTLWNEIIRRKLFDAEVAIKATSTINELFCCPELE
jgi:hypothetical protein